MLVQTILLALVVGQSDISPNDPLVQALLHSDVVQFDSSSAIEFAGYLDHTIEAAKKSIILIAEIERTNDDKNKLINMFIDDFCENDHIPVQIRSTFQGDIRTRPIRQYFERLATLQILFGHKRVEISFDPISMIYPIKINSLNGRDEFEMQVDLNQITIIYLGDGRRIVDRTPKSWRFLLEQVDNHLIPRLRSIKVTENVRGTSGNDYRQGRP